MFLRRESVQSIFHRRLQVALFTSVPYGNYRCLRCDSYRLIYQLSESEHPALTNVGHRCLLAKAIASAARLVKDVLTLTQAKPGLWETFLTSPYELKNFWGPGEQVQKYA